VASIPPSFPWLHWLHHSSFRIESQGQILYIDPYKVQNAVPADYIFVTHDHGDHFSPKDIRKIAKPSTILICPERVARQAQDIQVMEVNPGMDFKVGTIQGRAVPSYNRRKPMHPKSHGNIGFILDLPEGRVYHAGDTDFIDEMASPEFKGIKIALLPTGKTLWFLAPTMGPDQAVKAVQSMAPEFAVPMHYGTMPGSGNGGELFRKAVGEKALILTQEEPL